MDSKTSQKVRKFFSTGQRFICTEVSSSYKIHILETQLKPSGFLHIFVIPSSGHGKLYQMLVRLFWVFHSGRYHFVFSKNWWCHLWMVPVQPKFRCHPKLRQIVCIFWLLGSIVRISQSFPTTFSLLSQLPWKWWRPSKNIINICFNRNT